MSDSNYIKATDAIEEFKKMKDRRNEPMTITPAGPIEAGPKTLQAAEAIMKSTEKNDHLELAEKALEVMGWRKRNKNFCRNCAGYAWVYEKESRTFTINECGPLSNDLAAEGKRWLLSQFADSFLTIVVLPDEASVCIYSGEKEVIREKSRKKFSTENEAVLRAVVEIGKEGI